MLISIVQFRERVTSLMCSSL